MKPNCINQSCLASATLTKSLCHFKKSMCLPFNAMERIAGPCPLRHDPLLTLSNPRADHPATPVQAGPHRGPATSRDWTVVIRRGCSAGPHPSLRLRSRSAGCQRSRDVEPDAARADLASTLCLARARRGNDDPAGLGSLLDEVESARRRRCAGRRDAARDEQRDDDPQHEDLQPTCGGAASSRAREHPKSYHAHVSPSRTR
jgi:hypothetical protein